MVTSTQEKNMEEVSTNTEGALGTVNAVVSKEHPCASGTKNQRKQNFLDVAPLGLTASAL